jgi:DNA modification methylase
LQHGRGFVGIELKAEYAALARERIGKLNAVPLAEAS